MQGNTGSRTLILVLVAFQANNLADLEWTEVVERVARFEVDKTA